MPAAAEADSPTVAHHLTEGTLPQLVVEVQERGDDSTTRRVELVNANQRGTRPWLTDTQPPLIDNISYLNDNDRRYFIQLEEEMRSAAVRRRRHVYRAAMESNCMREIRATAQDRFLGLMDNQR